VSSQWMRTRFCLSWGARRWAIVAGRIRWVDADLRDPELPQRLDLNQQADAAISTTALHWLSPSELVEMLSKLTRILRPGAVFVNGDHLTFDSDQSRISNAVNQIRQNIEGGPQPSGAETWTEWWTAIEADPAFADLVTEHKSRWGGHADHHRPGEATFMSAALQRVGFVEVGAVWQWLDNRVLVAILGDTMPARTRPTIE